MSLYSHWCLKHMVHSELSWNPWHAQFRTFGPWLRRQLGLVWKSYIICGPAPGLSPASCAGSSETTSSHFEGRLMWALGRLDVLCVDGLRLRQTGRELLFSTKQGLQSRGKSPNAEPRCRMAADREGGLCHTEKSRVEEGKVEQINNFWLISGGSLK